MSTLRIRVDKFIESEGGPPPRVFARIQRIDDRGRSVAETLEHVLVPISSDPNQGEAISLAPGSYSVEVKLPSGEWLSDAVRVEEGGAQHLVLVATSPSRGWLSWQRLDNAERDPRVTKSTNQATRGSASSEPRSRTPRVSDNATRVARDVALARSMTERASTALERVGLRLGNDSVEPINEVPNAPLEPDSPADLDVGRALYWLEGGASKLSVDVLRSDPWRTLPALRGSTAHIVDVLNAGRTAFFVEPAMIDESSALFPVPNRSGLGATGFAPGQRTFAAVHRRMGVELVCVPTPWVDQMSDPDVAVEVSVQRPCFESEFASAVTVRDQQLAVLLGFLSSGALPSAKRLAETAGEILYGKNVNPLAAAAGGYALVSSAADTQYQRWHDWIENLMQRFEHLPDGAIQYGTMRMRLRTTETDFSEASRAFKLAYQRGLPFYGLGLRWLLEGLQRAGTRDPEAKVMAHSVQRLTARLHPQSPFTILRLGRQ